MKIHWLHIVLVSLALLVLAGGNVAMAGERSYRVVEAVCDDNPYDIALDKYEAICDECIRLRQKMLAGEAVPENAISSLVSELAALRKVLSGAEGDMSLAQRERFNRIRRHYNEAMGISEVEEENVTDSVAVEVHAPADTAKTTVVELTKVERKPMSIMALAVAEVYPEFSAGAMGAITRGRFGGYVKFRSNFNKVASSYEALSDGTSGSSYLWTTGQKKSSVLNISAGAMANFGHFYPYVGVGYGLRKVYWEDNEGLWAEITDLSHKGLCIDAGTVFSYEMLALSAGVTLIPSGYAAFEIGLGVRF